MDLIEKILKTKKMKGLGWEELALNLPINGNSLRMAFNRNSVDSSYLSEICKTLQIQETQNEPFNKTKESKEKRVTTIITDHNGEKYITNNVELIKLHEKIENQERAISKLEKENEFLRKNIDKLVDHINKLADQMGKK